MSEIVHVEGREILVTSPDERLQLDEPTAEIPRVDPIP